MQNSTDKIAERLFLNDFKSKKVSDQKFIEIILSDLLVRKHVEFRHMACDHPKLKKTIFFRKSRNREITDKFELPIIEIFKDRDWVSIQELSSRLANYSVILFKIFSGEHKLKKYFIDSLVQKKIILETHFCYIFKKHKLSEFGENIINSISEKEFIDFEKSLPNDIQEVMDEFSKSLTSEIEHKSGGHGMYHFMRVYPKPILP